MIGNSQHGFGSFRSPGLGAGAAMLRAEHGAASGLAESEFPDAARQPQANYAALDLGTNNCRLLIARPARGGFRVVDAFSRIVRLGEGLANSGELSEAAMAQLSAVGVPAGAVLDSMDLVNEPSFRERGILQTMIHGEREMTMPTWPVRFDGVPTEVKSAPLLGEHTAEVLADWLGLDDEAIAGLRQDGIV